MKANLSDPERALLAARVDFICIKLGSRSKLPPTRPKKKPPKLSATAQEILGHLFSFPNGRTVSRVASDLGLGRRQTYEVFKTLARREKIELAGLDKEGTRLWKIKKSPKTPK